MVINKEKEILEIWKNELDYRRKVCLHHMYTGLILAGGLFGFLINKFGVSPWLYFGVITILIILHKGTNNFSYLMDMWCKLIVLVHQNKILDFDMDKTSWVDNYIGYRPKYSKRK